jgi:hypothetical protein
MNRYALQLVSVVLVFAGISGSAVAKKPVNPPTSTAAPYFIDSSNPPKILGKAVSIESEFMIGYVFLSVIAPDGRGKNVTVAVGRSGFSTFSSSLVFESEDCSGTPFVSYGGRPPLPGLGPLAVVMQGDPSPNDGVGQTGALLFVATGGAAQSIAVRSTAYAMTLEAAAFSFVCQAADWTLDAALPFEPYGNLYDSYLRPYDIVIQ